jgi:hypothetical protein
MRSAHWERYQVEIDVPSGADAMTIGLALLGSGTAQFGDLRLESE